MILNHNGCVVIKTMQLNTTSFRRHQENKENELMVM